MNIPLTREQFLVFKQKMEDKGFSESNFNIQDRCIRCSGYDTYLSKIVDECLNGSDISSFDYQDTMETALYYIGCNVPPQYPGEEEEYSDETVDRWISAFTYRVLQNYLTLEELK